MKKEQRVSSYRRRSGCKHRELISRSFGAPTMDGSVRRKKGEWLMRCFREVEALYQREQELQAISKANSPRFRIPLRAIDHLESAQETRLTASIKRVNPFFVQRYQKRMRSGVLDLHHLHTITRRTHINIRRIADFVRVHLADRAAKTIHCVRINQTYRAAAPAAAG